MSDGPVFPALDLAASISLRMPFFSTAHLTALFTHYGYWVVFFGLLLESAGAPLPGETILLVASSFAASHANLHIGWIILIAIVAASTGDNAGYLIGRFGGRPLIDRYGRIFHIKPETVQQGEDLIRKHGALAVFFARFLAGLRVLNGILAGALHMEWRRFFLSNLLGAVCWVSIICLLGFFLGNRLPWLTNILNRAGLGLLAIVALGGLAVLWFHHHRSSAHPVAQKPND
jgi:membrane protein DedA with SNARE-associated domain